LRVPEDGITLPQKGRNAMNTYLNATLLAAALAVSAGCTSTASTSQADSCINPTHIAKQEIVSNEEIRFTLNDGEVWVNTLPRSCPGLRSQGGFTWEVTGTQVCSNQQRITVLNEGTPCQLGTFMRQPVQS
jgi:hypothetical protein